MSWSQREQRWTARRRISGKYEYGGSFDDPEEAARAADRLVRDAGYPSGCKLNFPFDAGVLSDAEERGLIIGSQKPIKPANVPNSQKTFTNFCSDSESILIRMFPYRSSPVIDPPLNFDILK